MQIKSRVDFKRQLDDLVKKLGLQKAEMPGFQEINIFFAERFVDSSDGLVVSIL